jgi:hypothetical protein
MKFLNAAKLGLILLTILVTLAAASEACADATPLATAVSPSSPAAVTPSSPTLAAPPGPSTPNTTTSPATVTTTPPATTEATSPAPPENTAPVGPAPAPPSTGPDPTIGTPAPLTATTTPVTTASAPTASTPSPPTPPAPPSTTTSQPSPAITPPTPAVPAPASTPPADPSAASPAPAPVASSTTTQVIVQVQVSGCTSNCQGLSQVQAASQTTVDVEALGTSGQQASALEGQAAPPPPTSTITQIQIGCLTQCFGTTSTGTTPEPLAEQILGELSSLVPPDGSTSVPPPAGTELQSVVDQVTCQLQTGGPTASGTDVQTASQTSTTVQLVDPSASTGSQTPAPSAVDQTEQQTWQLQIGCLFYCSGTQQLQQAQQTITTVQVLVEPPGSPTSSTAGAGTVTGQVIWQVQIGCLAWCYDATQVQDATSQTTVRVITVVQPVSDPPASTPPAATTTGPPPTPAPAAAQPAAAGAPSVPATPTSPVSSGSTTWLMRSIAQAGIAVVDRRPGTAGVPAPAPSVARVAIPAAGAQSPSAPRVFVSREIGRSSPRPHTLRRSRAEGSSAGAAYLAAIASRPASTPSMLLVALGFLGAAVALTLGGIQLLGRTR